MIIYMKIFFVYDTIYLCLPNERTTWQFSKITEN